MSVDPMRGVEANAEKLLGQRERVLSRALRKVTDQAEAGGFDLDSFLAAEVSEPPRPEAALTLSDLEMIAAQTRFALEGILLKPLGAGEFSYGGPGYGAPIRVTPRAGYFDEHSDSMELWSMGSPAFPAPTVSRMTISPTEFQMLLRG